jgi:hypothetical protein
VPWGGIGAGAGLATSFWQCSINFAPERAIALSSSKAKSSLLMFVVATTPSFGVSNGRHASAARLRLYVSSISPTFYRSAAGITRPLIPGLGRQVAAKARDRRPCLVPDATCPIRTANILDPSSWRQFGAIRNEPGNLCLHDGWEDSNFQPSGYCRDTSEPGPAALIYRRRGRGSTRCSVFLRADRSFRPFRAFS